MPYGIGAKFGNPDRPVIVFAGDGAMQMNGMAELITIKHYWQQWADPRLVVAILHNNDLNQVTWEMRAMAGSPKFAESQTLPDVDYAAFASSLGLHGIRSTSPTNSRRPGTAPCRLTGPPSWTCAATPTSRRSRRTRRTTRSRTPPRRCCNGDENRGASSARASRPRPRSSSRTERTEPWTDQIRPYALSATVDEVDVAVYTVPTDQPEADGTCAWDATTMVLVEVRAGTTTGSAGPTAPPAVGAVVRDQLAGLVRGLDAMDVGAAFEAMVKDGPQRRARRGGRLRHLRGRLALWDLKARLLGLPLHRLLGAVRERVPVYGSGGFTTYDDAQLATSSTAG